MGFFTQHIKYQLLGHSWVCSPDTIPWHVPGAALSFPACCAPKVLSASMCLSSLRTLQEENVSQHGPKDLITQ